MIKLEAKIYLDEKRTIDIDSRNSISISANLSDRSSLTHTAFGIISNTGNIEFKDIDGSVLILSNQRALVGNLKCEIFLRNTLSKSQQKVATMETGTWNYDSNNRAVSVSIKDNLEEWQNIQIDGFDYDPRNPAKVLPNKSLSDLYKWLHERTPEKYQMLSFAELNAETQSILDITILQCPLLKSATLWRQWTKLCEVCGLYIYADENARTVCNYTYGS